MTLCGAASSTWDLDSYEEENLQSWSRQSKRKEANWPPILNLSGRSLPPLGKLKMTLCSLSMKTKQPQPSFCQCHFKMKQHNANQCKQPWCSMVLQMFLLYLCCVLFLVRLFEGTSAWSIDPAARLLRNAELRETETLTFIEGQRMLRLLVSSESRMVQVKQMLLMTTF